ncbi:MAG: pilus assembly protein [Gammaproteobacteria bacterium]|nr:pilus assembly protein [Gammaproteobacteria bacterium]
MSNLQKSLNKQTGAVLAISLIMLLLLTLIGTTGMQVTSLEEKMAGNMRDQILAFQAAESTLNFAEANLKPEPVFVDAGTDGFYSEASAIPSSSAILLASFWSSNPVATYAASGLGNGVTDSRYIVQKMVDSCVSSTLPCPTADQMHNYRVTVRATGGTTSSVVMLQSTYQTPL